MDNKTCLNQIKYDFVFHFRMIFARTNVESFGFVLVILFSISLCSGNDGLTSGADNGGAEPFDDPRGALPYSVIILFGHFDKMY